MDSTKQIISEENNQKRRENQEKTFLTYTESKLCTVGEKNNATTHEDEHIVKE